MAGVKGKSGRKAKPRKAAVLLSVTGEEPLEFLLNVMKDRKAPADLRIRAAVCAAQYIHTRTRDGGKNIVKTEKSKDAATGKFAPGSPPKLVVNNGGREGT